MAKDSSVNCAESRAMIRRGTFLKYREKVELMRRCRRFRKKVVRTMGNQTIPFEIISTATN
jgi:hypothetical protein